VTAPRCRSPGDWPARVGRFASASRKVRVRESEGSRPRVGRFASASRGIRVARVGRLLRASRVICVGDTCTSSRQSCVPTRPRPRFSPANRVAHTAGPSYMGPDICAGYRRRVRARQPAVAPRRGPPATSRFRAPPARAREFPDSCTPIPRLAGTDSPTRAHGFPDSRGRIPRLAGTDSPTRGHRFPDSRAPIPRLAGTDPPTRGGRGQRAAASWAACRSASTMLRSSAWPVPAMSNAVP
jgi:hypothetical protein